MSVLLTPHPLQHRLSLVFLSLAILTREQLMLSGSHTTSLDVLKNVKVTFGFDVYVEYRE